MQESGGGEELGIGVGIDGAGVAGAEGTRERHAGRARSHGTVWPGARSLDFFCVHLEAS